MQTGKVMLQKLIQDSQVYGARNFACTTTPLCSPALGVSSHLQGWLVVGTRLFGMDLLEVICCTLESMKHRVELSSRKRSSRREDSFGGNQAFPLMR